MQHFFAKSIYHKEDNFISLKAQLKKSNYICLKSQNL